MTHKLELLGVTGKWKQDLETRIQGLDAAKIVREFLNGVARHTIQMGDAFEDFKKSLQMTEQQRTRRYPEMVYVKSPAFGAIIPGDSAAEAVLASGFLNFLNLYNSALIIRLVLTWFPNPPEVIVSPLSTLCDPYLNLFRGIIPPLGGTLDFSPILAFLVLNVFTNTAAALPAELPKEEGKDPPPTPAVPDAMGWIQPSAREQLWAKLTAGRRMQQQNQD